MKLSAVLFLSAVSTVLAGLFLQCDLHCKNSMKYNLCMKTLVFPTETSTSYVEMTPLTPLSLCAFTLCMRVATELSGEREIILFAYWTQDFDELNVWRELDGRLSFYLNRDGVVFKTPELVATETHLCFTWDSSSGAAAVFLDGRKSMTKIYRKGHTIRSGGKVILGQDPDTYFSDFEAKQSFVGEIGDVNMWDTVLSDSTIRDMFNGKKVERGNVFSTGKAHSLELMGQW